MRNTLTVPKTEKLEKLFTEKQRAAEKIQKDRKRQDFGPLTKGNDREDLRPVFQYKRSSEISICVTDSMLLESVQEPASVRVRTRPGHTERGAAFFQDG